MTQSAGTQLNGTDSGRTQAVSRWRAAVLLALLLGSLLYLLSWPSFGQELAYHQFVDVRSYFGIPRELDVLSNLPFLLIGVVGFWQCRQLPALSWRLPWQVFFAGVALVGIGSAYYHWAPDNERLVWDRIPMTVGFMGLVTALLAEQVSERAARWLLWPAVLIGVASVGYWFWFDDLRWYYWVQLAPMLVIVAMQVLFAPAYSHRSVLLATLGFYLLAKYAEFHDAGLYALAGISGHTVKHLLAAAACASVLLMLHWRRRL